MYGYGCEVVLLVMAFKCIYGDGLKLLYKNVNHSGPINILFVLNVADLSNKDVEYICNNMDS